ncbi:hypothetical protein SCAR479_00241 [Seiridium cardinale]|uniref:Amidohydrolase-related domain-containing protein n=1 Tax=Seiridium cardinale TaxID=138064 RepID=A0ABR2Y9M6_9PEZI
MTVVIRADRVVLNSKDDLISDGVVVIEGQNILLEYSLKSATVKHLGDVTLMPGLFDCHVHLQMGPSDVSTSSAINLEDDALLRLIARNASKLLDAGATTCRDLGSRDLTTASILISTGGFMTAGSHPSQARFSPDEMAAIRDEATKHGLSITTHATGMQGIDRAADAHFDCIEHCASINPDSKAEFDPVVAQKLVDGNIAMREIRIRLVTGTDSGSGLCRFERYAAGLTVLADAGYTSRRLEAGFAADLATFAGNPLEDVTAYGEPRFVMALGREHGLSPIEPLGDIKEKADLTLKLLREGAGINK